jgi:hypothetical protein
MKLKIAGIALVTIGVLLVLFAILFYPLVPTEKGVLGDAIRYVAIEGLSPNEPEFLSPTIDLDTTLPQPLVANLKRIGMTSEQLQTVKISRNVALQDSKNVSDAIFVMAASIVGGLFFLLLGISLVVAGVMILRHREVPDDPETVIIDELISLRARLKRIEDTMDR